MATVVTKTVKPGGGGDYTSLQSWESANQKNLVSADEISRAECYAGGNLLSANNLGISGWTTDKTRYIDIVAADSHAHRSTGVFDDGYAYMKSTNGRLATISEDCKIRGIQLYSSANTAYQNGLYVNLGCNYLTVDRCFALFENNYTGNNDTGMFRGANTATGQEKLMDITNTICLIDHQASSTNMMQTMQFYMAFDGTITQTLTLYNNTFINPPGSAAAGSRNTQYVRNTGSNGVSDNNYCHGSSTGMYQTASGSTWTKGAADSSSDTQVTTVALQSVAYSTTNFTNVTGGSEDLTPKTGSALTNAGTDLSAKTPSVTEDIFGTSRAQGSAYEIGAIEPQVDALALADGLISYWNLDETSGTTLIDTKGSNDLTKTGTAGAITLGATGKFSGGADYDKSIDSTADMSIAVADYVGLDWNDFTVSFWVNQDDLTNKTFVAKTGSGSNWVLESWNSLGKLNFYANGAPAGSTRWDCQSSGVVGTGMRHVVVSRERLSANGTTGLKIYIDGVQGITAAISGNTDSINANVNDLQIGNGGSYSMLDAAIIDEIGYWNRALTQAEVDDIYNSGSGKTYSATSDSFVEILSEVASVSGSSSLSATMKLIMSSTMAGSSSLVAKQLFKPAVSGIGALQGRWCLNPIDSYPVINANSFDLVWSNTAKSSQSFTGDGQKVGSVTFYGHVAGTPPGNLTCSIYAHSGTFGTSSVPTGSALATAVNSISPTDIDDVLSPDPFLGLNGEIKFIFDGTFTVVNGTKYTVVVEGPLGTISNTYRLSTDTTSPTHGGNAAQKTGSSWVPVATKDYCFCVGGQYTLTGLSVIAGSSSFSSPPRVIMSSSIAGSAALSAVGAATQNIEANSDESSILFSSPYFEGDEVAIEGIWNTALVHLGAPIVASTSDTTSEAILINAIWEDFWEEFLTDHSWNGAKTTLTLSKLVDGAGAAVTPPERWSYAFALPSNYLQAIRVNGRAMQPETNTFVEIETILIDAVYTKALFTNDATCDLEYLFDVGNQVSLLKPKVRQACGMLLAARIAGSFGKNEDEIRGIVKRAENMLADARAIDGQENTSQFFAEQPLLTARSRRGSGRR